MKQVVFHLSDIPVRYKYLVIKKVKNQDYVFHSKKTIFFSLNPTAFRILELCDGTHSIHDIIHLISDEFNIDQNEIIKDIAEYLVTLVETEMLDIQQSKHEGERTNGSL